MCWTTETSLLTFTIGLITSLLIIYNGNLKYKKENMIFGIFFIFISFIQFFDFLFWIDIDNKYNINHYVTLIAPLINAGQPTILYIIKILLLNNYNDLIETIATPYNLFFLIANILYAVFLIINYIRFLNNGKLTVSISKKTQHLEWPWVKYFSFKPYYLIMLAINIFYLTNFNYSLFLFIISYFFLYLSNKYFKYNVGELWCFFGAFIPIFLYLYTYYF
jgi:hypothetical protein